MEKLTIQSLRSIFDLIESKPETVLWIRDKTYQRQLYISPTYEQIWQHTVEKLYEHPLSWNDYLHPQDKDRLLTRIDQETENAQDLNSLQTLDDSLVFRINSGLRQTKYIKDTRFVLVNENDNIVGHMGIDEVITEQQWFNAKDKRANTPDDMAKKHLKIQVFNLLKAEFNLHAQSEAFDGIITPKLPQFTMKCDDSNVIKRLELTERETECLHHLATGKSSKQTASFMDISPRTVEFHLNNIKLKTNSRTKIEILSKIIQPQE